MSLPVSDPRASRDWYTANFGFEVEFETPDTIAIRDDAGFTIFLYKAGEPLVGARTSLTFQVQDVETKHRELSARGVLFLSPPGKHFWGYGAELDDPDGYRVLLWDETSMREKG